MSELRDYQRRALDELYAWFGAGNPGHPCVVMPTGSGKSHVIAHLCQEAITQWPDTRILMLTHVKELIEQNSNKMLELWPDAPLGIYSAGMGKREVGREITFAGIQSVRSKADMLGHIDLLIIDEAHRVSHNSAGGYRKVIGELLKINPALRVIGFTATPYRLGHGMITDKPAIFDEALYPVSIQELIHIGHLSKLVSIPTELKIDASKVGVTAGEYKTGELEELVDTSLYNDGAVREVIACANGRKSWLFFCAGVHHANAVALLLMEYGINAAVVTGDTDKIDRAQILNDFRAGKIQAITNCDVLTTGFDAPNIDLIALLRPTLSPGLYVQMIGRGLRTAEGKTDCAVLDFVGCIEKHGPITAVKPPGKPKQTEDAGAPTKECPECHAKCHAACTSCPSCGFVFPQGEGTGYLLRDDDIMGVTKNIKTMKVTDWAWRPHVSKSSGKEMLAVTYYGSLSDPSVTEYYPVLHNGAAGDKARADINGMIGTRASPVVFERHLLGAISKAIATNIKPPRQVSYTRSGNFYKVTAKIWGG